MTFFGFEKRLTVQDDARRALVEVIYQTDPRVRGELIVRMLDFVEDFLPTVRMIRRKKRERFLAGE